MGERKSVAGIESKGKVKGVRGKSSVKEKKIVLSKTRNSQIDVLRGMAIILVVMEHCIGSSDNAIAKVILSFHMPLFFIISGYLSHSEKTRSFNDVVLKKAKSLLIPQLTLACISFAYNWLISDMLLHQATAEDLNFIYCFTRWWFLLVMFEINLLWELIIRIKVNCKVRDAVIIVISVLYTILIPQGTSGPLYILVAPVALGFFALGNLVKDYLQCFADSIKKYRYPLIFVGGGITVLVGLTNSSVLMYENQYGNILLYIITSIAGFLTLYLLAGCMENNRFFSWCGRNSIIIYVIHFSVVQATRGILVRILPSLSDYISILVFAVASFIVIIGTYICEKWFGFLFGKGIKRTSEGRHMR